MDLSDNYVYCNDDYYFLNPTTKEMFFVNDLPVYYTEKKEIERIDASGEDGTFYQTLNNGMDLQQRICGNKAHWYSFDHLPVSHKKDFEKEILDQYYDTFINANKKSRFRHKDNFTIHFFLCLYRDLKPYYKYNGNRNSCYVSVRKDTNFDDFGNYDMICFNDTQLLEPQDFNETKNKMVSFFEKRFPNKSKYEK